MTVYVVEASCRGLSEGLSALQDEDLEIWGYSPLYSQNEWKQDKSKTKCIHEPRAEGCFSIVSRLCGFVKAQTYFLYSIMSIARKNLKRSLMFCCASLLIMRAYVVRVFCSVVGLLGATNTPCDTKQMMSGCCLMFKKCDSGWLIFGPFSLNVSLLFVAWAHAELFNLVASLLRPHIACVSGAINVQVVLTRTKTSSNSYHDRSTIQAPISSCHCGLWETDLISRGVIKDQTMLEFFESSTP